MNYLVNLFTLLLLFKLTTAQPSPVIRSDSDDKPTKPTRLFTVAAYESPYPVGQGLTGVIMHAQGGGFFLNPSNSIPSTECDGVKPCPPGNETVLFVDKYGKAWLDSAHPQPIYIDAQSGPLSYVVPSSTIALPSGAIFVDFIHLGSGTGASSGNSSGFAAPPSGIFNWIGDLNEFWLACPRPGPGYQVLKSVSAIISAPGCSTVQLAAVDYSGKSPAAGKYV